VLQVTLIAQGDVALSIVVTVCTTLAAVVLTPLLTKILAGAIVPVDAVKLSLSTLQVTDIYLGRSIHDTSCFVRQHIVHEDLLFGSSTTYIIITFIFIFEVRSISIIMQASLN